MESAGIAPSVTFEAGATAIIYTEDHNSALSFFRFPTPDPNPPNAGGHETPARPLDPFSEACHDTLHASVSSTGEGILNRPRSFRRLRLPKRMAHGSGAEGVGFRPIMLARRSWWPYHNNGPQVVPSQRRTSDARYVDLGRCVILGAQRSRRGCRTTCTGSRFPKPDARTSGTTPRPGARRPGTRPRGSRSGRSACDGSPPLHRDRRPLEKSVIKLPRPRIAWVAVGRDSM